VTSGGGRVNCAKNSFVASCFAAIVGEREEVLFLFSDGGVISVAGILGLNCLWFIGGVITSTDGIAGVVGILGMDEGTVWVVLR
jgi:hypothetical protein